MNITLTTGLTIECDYCTATASGSWTTKALGHPGVDVHWACRHHLPTMDVPN